MKIVLDTNVVVSGLLGSRGNPAQVLALVLGGAVQICYDERILAEYSEVLVRPRFQFDPRRVREVLNKIERDGISVEVAGLQKFHLPDPDDECFLAVAVAASVDHLVTGNMADYPTEKCRGCAVVTPTAFIANWHRLHPN